MNVNLGPTFDAFVERMLKSGLYQSQSEVLREGLRFAGVTDDPKTDEGGGEMKRARAN